MDSLTENAMTLILIGLNIAVSLFGFSRTAFTERYLLHVGAILQQRQWDRLITSGFLHGGFFHLAMNLYVLFMFGRIVEQILGSTDFLIVYLASLLGGSCWSVLENLRKPDYRALGASGAVSGIVMSLIVFAPTATFYPLGIPMPGLVFGFAFISISAVLAQNENKVIGHEAHLGGALAGLLTTFVVYPDSLSIFSTQIAALWGGQ